MTIVRGKLANIQTLPSTVESIYTNPASTETFVSGFTLFNSNTSAETVKLYAVPNSGGSIGTAADTNQFLDISLAAKETFIFQVPGDGIVLDGTNDTIQGFTTTASKVTVILHGAKEV